VLLSAEKEAENAQMYGQRRPLMKTLKNSWNGKKRMLPFAALAAAMLLTSAVVKADDTAIALAWVAAWNTHDADQVTALFTPDAIYEDVPLGAVSHGTAQIRAFAQAFFDAVPDSRIIYVGSSIKGGHGVIEWVFTGTDVGIHRTGKIFAVRGATVLDLQGTKITRNSDYYDLATLLRQIGLLPPGL
jgi:steroid delta-isomerase-like uncharacterized protein